MNILHTHKCKYERVYTMYIHIIDCMYVYVHITYIFKYVCTCTYMDIHVHKFMNMYVVHLEPLFSVYAWNMPGIYHVYVVLPHMPGIYMVYPWIYHVYPPD